MGEVVKRAIAAGDAEALAAERLNELGIDVNDTIGTDGYTPLHWACHYGKAELLVYFLCDKHLVGVPVTALNDSNNNQLKVLQHLLELGADISLRTRHDWTGVHICAIRGCTVCLRVLSSNGADLSATDSRGYTCAHMAAAHGKRSVLEAVIKARVDVWNTDKRGWSILHHAAFHGRMCVIQLLNKMNHDPLAGDREGNIPAHLAAAEGHLECLRLLVYSYPEDQTAEVVSCRNHNGSTPKDLAQQFHKQDCVDFLTLVENEAETYECDEREEYPAHAAASVGNLQLLSMLIQEGHCGVNDRDTHNATPAHKAARNGHTECLQWLVDHGANVSLRNSAGETPKDVAKRFTRVGCLAVLGGGTADSSDNELESCDETPSDHPSPQALTRAWEKVEELQKQLEMAKTRYQQLGGELEEDSQIKLLEKEHNRQLSILESQLAYERERREVLEAELDQLRKQLQGTTDQLEHYQALAQKQTAVTPDLERSPVKSPKSLNSKRKPRRRNITGGAFIRIDPL